MSSTLITFLGRKTAHGYDRVTYDFDGIEKTASFFGLALAEVIKPDRLSILGTKGSMWDVLVESLAHSGELEDERISLIGNAENHAVTQSQLDSLAPLISHHLGLDCRLTIIPRGTDESEQVEILRIMAQGVNPHDRAILDITHAFRHLPMLAFVSALYLESVRNAHIENIYYGAFDMMHDKVVPALRLDGLMRVARWIKALSTYDKDGDYGVFAELFKQEGIANAKMLQRAVTSHDKLGRTFRPFLG